MKLSLIFIFLAKTIYAHNNLIVNFKICIFALKQFKKFFHRISTNTNAMEKRRVVMKPKLKRFKCYK